MNKENIVEPNSEIDETDLVYRLRLRAEIRRKIPTRKSVQEGSPDRIADLLEEAANEIDTLKTDIARLEDLYHGGSEYSE